MAVPACHPNNSNPSSLSSASLLLQRFGTMSFALDEPPGDDKLKNDGVRGEVLSSSSALAVEAREPVPEYTESDAEALFTPPAPPPADVKLNKLDLPVALPQINTNYDSAFLRAFTPVLGSSGITQEDWLKIIDGLNIAIVRSLARIVLV